jgi:hypothetical protein
MDKTLAVGILAVILVTCVAAIVIGRHSYKKRKALAPVPAPPQSKRAASTTPAQSKKIDIDLIVDRAESLFKSLFKFAASIVLLWFAWTWVFDLDEKGDVNAASPAYRCLSAIEDRNWDHYVATFEPSAVLHATSPGLFVHFLEPQAEVIEKGDQTALVEVKATVKVDGKNFQWPLAIRLNMVKVNRGGLMGFIGLKKWYISASDISQMPFKVSY